MQYAGVIAQVERLIALEPTNWGAPLQKLFEQVYVSGWELYLAFRHNNFQNPLQQADEQRYKERGSWTEILRDTVKEGGKGRDYKGRLDLVYISHAGTGWEKTHRIWAPFNGWYVPTDDGIFHEGTLIPFETLGDKKEAIRRCEAKGIPAEQVSYFNRPSYSGLMLMGRDFDMDSIVGGRFRVDADAGSMAGFGDKSTASRPHYEGHGKPEIVMEVSSPQRPDIMWRGRRNVFRPPV